MTGAGRDERLDRALAQWADEARLPVAVGAEMLDSIMSTPAPALSRPRLPSALPLPRSWWREHSAGLATTFISSTRPLADVA